MIHVSLFFPRLAKTSELKITPKLSNSSLYGKRQPNPRIRFVGSGKEIVVDNSEALGNRESSDAKIPFSFSKRAAAECISVAITINENCSCNLGRSTAEL